MDPPDTSGTSVQELRNVRTVDHLYVGRRITWRSPALALAIGWICCKDRTHGFWSHSHVRMHVESVRLSRVISPIFPYKPYPMFGIHWIERAVFMKTSTRTPCCTVVVPFLSIPSAAHVGGRDVQACFSRVRILLACFGWIHLPLVLVGWVVLGFVLDITRFSASSTHVVLDTNRWICDPASFHFLHAKSHFSKESHALGEEVDCTCCHGHKSGAVALLRWSPHVQPDCDRWPLFLPSSFAAW